MNAIKKIYCRVFQTGMRIALPFLPYREPKLIEASAVFPPCCRSTALIASCWSPMPACMVWG